MKAEGCANCKNLYDNYETLYKNYQKLLEEHKNLSIYCQNLIDSQQNLSADYQKLYTELHNQQRALKCGNEDAFERFPPQQEYSQNVVEDHGFINTLEDNTGFLNYDNPDNFDEHNTYEVTNVIPQNLASALNANPSKINDSPLGAHIEMNEKTINFLRQTVSYVIHNNNNKLIYDGISNFKRELTDKKFYLKDIDNFFSNICYNYIEAQRQWFGTRFYDSVASVREAFLAWFYYYDLIDVESNNENFSIENLKQLAVRIIRGEDFVRIRYFLDNFKKQIRGNQFKYCYLNELFSINNPFLSFLDRVKSVHGYLINKSLDENNCCIRSDFFSWLYYYDLVYLDIDKDKNTLEYLEEFFLKRIAMQVIREASLDITKDLVLNMRMFLNGNKLSNDYLKNFFENNKTFLLTTLLIEKGYMGTAISNEILAKKENEIEVWLYYYELADLSNNLDDMLKQILIYVVRNDERTENLLDLMKRNFGRNIIKYQNLETFLKCNELFLAKVVSIYANSLRTPLNKELMVSNNKCKILSILISAGIVN